MRKTDPRSADFFFFVARDLPTSLRHEAVQEPYKSQGSGFPLILVSIKVLVTRFLRVLPKSSYKQLILRVGLYQHATMSTSSKVPEGLKDSECKKGKLGAHPPIPYIPPTDLLQAKENSDSIKLKLPDGTVISMTIFAKGNPEEYLQHAIAVLRLINQTGLDTKGREAGKELVRTSESPGGP